MKRNLLLESSKNTQCEKVVITGMGIISSIGKDLAEFEESLKAGRSGIGILNSSNKPSQSNIGASVSDFSFETKVKSHLQPEYNELLKGALNLGKRAPVSVKCSIASAVEAWIMARLHEKQVYGRRTGIIIAGSNLSCGYQYGLYKDFVDAPEYLSPTYAMYFMDTDHLAAVSQLLGIHGEGYTTGGASASGNVGIINGYRLIKNGIVDVCVVIGAMADLSPMEIQGFINIGALGGKKYWSKPESACRPFDIEHEGFIYGQAAACLVLESYNSALIRDVPVLAEIMGGAIVIDGNRKPDPNEEGEAAAMRHAIESAGLQKEDIDYINAHGSASPLG
ncbi:MAG TPA: beta-ketoacyl synthase N-terminal-like domain-containing protein, partial [Bacillota bacterium]|nr:beta-ketoacyl synthase N-terminal-like domain-containing protein [Bacillota bacterium]